MNSTYRLEYTETFKRLDDSVYHRARSVAWDEQRWGDPTSANIGRWVNEYLASVNANMNSSRESAPAVTQGCIIRQRNGALVVSWSGFCTPKI